MKKETFARYIGSIITFGIIHYAAVRLGLQMAYVQENVSAVWPPSGIALAILFLFGARMWPGIALSVFIGSILDGDLPGIALGLAFANTAEAIIGVWLLRKMKFDKLFARVNDVITLALSCGIATVLSATLGSVTIYLLQDNSISFNLLWLTWWIGNFLGCLVVTPFILVWRQTNIFNIAKKKVYEGLALVLVLIIVTWIVFSVQSESAAINQALIYVIFPFIILTALRVEIPGVTTAIVVVTGIAVFKSIHNNGPFSSNTINDSLILLQTFMGVVTLISLILTVTLSERKKSEESLNQRIQGLAALNVSSKVLLNNLGEKNIHQIICELAVEQFYASAVWIESVNDNNSVPNPIAFAPTEIQSPDFEFSDFLMKQQIREIIKKAEIESLPYIQTQLKPSGDKAEKIADSFVVLPLRYSEKIIGMLCVLNLKPNLFVGDQVLLLQSYTNLAAVALQNNLLFEQVQMGNEQLHALSNRLMNVQEAERYHLSQELHDESGQILAILMVHLGLLERDAGNSELIHEHVQSLREIVKSVIDNLHRIAVNLRPASLDKLGLVIGLQQYVKDFLPQQGINVEIDVVDKDIGRFAEEIETALFRIVQESLSNVILHANATQVDILLNKRNGSIIVMIEDNGKGFKPDVLIQNDRLGLFGIRERIRVLGGKLQIESTPGKGTTIVVEVPYENKHINSR